MLVMVVPVVLHPFLCPCPSPTGERQHCLVGLGLHMYAEMIHWYEYSFFLHVFFLSIWVLSVGRLDVHWQKHLVAALPQTGSKDVLSIAFVLSLPS